MSTIELNYNKLLSRMNAIRIKENGMRLASGILKTIAITSLLILFVSIIEAIANGDMIFRGVLAGIAFIGFIVSSGTLLGPNIARFTGLIPYDSYERIALRIGAVYPEIKDRLCNGIQIFTKSNNNTSKELALAAFGDISAIASNKDFNAILDRKELKNSFLIFLFAIIISSLSYGIFPNMLGESFYRIINFNKSFLPPAPFTITLDPMRKNAVRGENIIIKVKATGLAPEFVTLYIKESQQENYDAYKLRLDTGNSYSFQISSIKQSISYYALTHWLNTAITTEIGKISVSDKPLVRSISGVLIQPSYSGLPPRNFYEDNADLSGLIGSKVEMNIISNKEIKSAWVVIERSNRLIADISEGNSIGADTVRIPLRADGKRATGSFRLSASGQYYLSLLDKDGERNENPIKYNIIALKDEYPAINLIEPNESDAKVSENAFLPMKVGISDDYGFSKLTLNYRLAESRYAEPDKNFKQMLIPLLNSDKSAEVPYIWDLNKMGISPEDKYEYYVEVFDNDIISGPKSAKSGLMSVRLPSLDEVLETANESQKKIEKELEKVLKEANEVRKEMQELNRELLKDFNKKELDWKEKKKAEEIAKKQEELAKRLEDVKDKIDETAKDLEQNKAISPETLQKYLELQRLMSEVNSPELKKMQEKMEQALNQISPEQMQKMLKDIQFDEEKFRQSIERTMKILKRLQAEQKVDALTKRAEEMAEKQEDLAKQTENTNPNDKQAQNDLARQQKQLQTDLNKLNKELADLKQMMKEIGEEMPIGELDKAQDELNMPETEQEMMNASQQMQKGNMNQSKQSQRKAGSNLKKFAQQMNKLKQEMQDRTTKEAMKKMSKAMSDLLSLSKQQEKIKDQTQSSDYNSTQIPDLAENQSSMFESLANVANAMMQLSEKSFSVTPEMAKSLGDALEEMQNATEQLANRRPNNALKSQSNAMSSMNQAVSQMQSMMSAMQNQGSGSCNNPGGSGQGDTPGGMGFGERLQQLAAQQQAINQAMQQVMQGQNGQMSREQQAEYGRIAQEQGKARKSAQELADEQKKFADGNKQALGDLKKISQEMEEVLSDLQGGVIKQETLNRQEKILSRLLDATKSINDRDFEKRRESRTGKDMQRNSPDQINPNKQEGKSSELQELMRRIQQGYTRDYESLIKKYFDAIQSKQ